MIFSFTPSTSKGTIMNFFIDTITNHSVKANKVLIRFVKTDTILDDCSINIYVPKSIELKEGEVFDLPFFICDGIWGSFLRSTHIKNLERQVKAKAPKGHKMEMKAKTVEIFDSLRALNVKEETPITEEIGQFVGKIGDKVMLTLNIDKILYSNNWCDESSWRHNGHGWEHPYGTSVLWQLSDSEGNIFIFKNSGKATEAIDNAFNQGKKILVTAEIINQSVFRGVRQNCLYNLRIKEVI